MNNSGWKASGQHGFKRIAPWVGYGLERERSMSLRMLGITSVFLLLIACQCSLPKADNRWSVVSWNVQNLFDGEDDGNEYKEFDPGTDSWSERLYRRRLDRCAEVLENCLSELPDLIVLQELEKPEILDDLADGLPGRGKYHWRVAVPGFGIIRCGILSRYPLRDIEVVDCGKYGVRSLRPALSFIVDSPGGSVNVVAVHWKSPRDGRAATEAARRQEALQVRKIVEDDLRADSSHPVLIIGDMNTPGDGKVTPAALAPWNPENAADAHDAVLLRSEYKQAVGMREDSYVFFDPEPVGPAGGTYWFRDEWSRPDRALLSRGMLHPPGIVFESCFTGASEVMGGFANRPVSWRSDLEEGYSDHLPLILEFRVEGER